MESKQLILLGPPGVGAKTQATALAKRWHVPYVSVGELVRAEVAQGSELGAEIKPCVEAGELIPDELVMKLMRRRFEQPDVMLTGWILDGFPRSLAQAKLFDEFWSGFGQSAAEVIYLQATTGVLMNRLMTGPNPDGSVAAIRQRLKQYQEMVEPLLDYYKQRSRLNTINASRSVAEVTNELSQMGDENVGAARFIRDEAELDVLVEQEFILVVDCVASWCGPCKLVTPMIDRLAEEMGDRATVVKLDFDHNRQVSKRFGLKGMPSVMIFKEGELMTTLTGVKSYELYSSVVQSLLP